MNKKTIFLLFYFSVLLFIFISYSSVYRSIFLINLLSLCQSVYLLINLSVSFPPSFFLPFYFIFLSFFCRISLSYLFKAPFSFYLTLLLFSNSSFQLQFFICSFHRTLFYSPCSLLFRPLLLLFLSLLSTDSFFSLSLIFLILLTLYIYISSSSSSLSSSFCVFDYHFLCIFSYFTLQILEDK